MDAQMIGWAVSFGTAIYMVHYKTKVDREKTTEEKRLTAMEAAIAANGQRTAALEKSESAHVAEVVALKERHNEFREAILASLNKVDDKLDRLGDKLDQVLLSKK